MLVIDYAPVSVDRRQYWLSIQRLLCASYVIDVMVLESFVMASLAPWWLPLRLWRRSLPPLETRRHRPQRPGKFPIG